MHRVIFEMEEFLSVSGKTQYHKYQKYLAVLSTTFARTMGKHDPSLLVHSRQVADLAEKLATRLGLTAYQVRLARHAGMFHDIGKLAISRTILCKSAAPSQYEHELLRNHPAMGVAFLQACPEFDVLIPFIHYHHEAYNGRGYPVGLVGEQIPIEARIIAVAEAVDSMLSDHPYRQAYTVQQATDELQRCSGTQFDPNVVETAINVLLENRPKNMDSAH